MPRASALFVFIWVFLFLTHLDLRQANAADPDYVLAIADQAGIVEGAETISVTLTNTAAPVTGFQFAVCDDALVDTSFGDVLLGAAVDERFLETFAIDFEADSWSVATVFTAGTALAPGETHELIVAAYALLETGDSELTFCASVLEPMVTLDSGTAVEPVTDPGIIEVAPPRFFLRGDANADGRVDPLLDAWYFNAWRVGAGEEPPCLEAADFNDNGAASGNPDLFGLLRLGFEEGAEPPYPGRSTCGTEAGGGDLGCEVYDLCPSDPPDLSTDSSVRFSFGETLDTVEVGEEIVLPVRLNVSDEAINGLQFAVCHGDGISLPDGTGPFSPVELSDYTSTYMGYAGISLFEDGWIAGFLPDDSLYGTIGPGEFELLRVTYVIEEEGVWTIEFCDELGDPPIGNRAIRDSAFLLPELAEPKVIEGFFDIAEGLAFSPEHGKVGETVDVSVLISNLFDRLDAWHWGVCHDEKVSIGDGDVVAGAALDGLTFSTHIVTVEESGWTATAILDLSSGGTLAPGIRHEAYIATYTLGNSSGNSTLSFCDDLGDPPVTIGWVVDGSEREPETFVGTISIEAVYPFTFGVSVPPISYDPADLSGGISFAVDLTIQEDAFNPGFPNSTVGLSMGIGHDSTIIEPVSAEPTGIVAAIAGGTGPAFALLDIAPDGDVDGVVIGILYSFFGASPLEFAKAEPVVTIRYEVTDNALTDLASDPDGLVSTLEWRDDIGDPLVANTIIVGDEAVLPGFADGVVKMVPPEFLLPFLRGDCNGNGVVSGLTDGLYLLGYGFLGEDPPPCLDAADADDSGTVSALTDTLYLLRWQFSGGLAPPAPGTSSCGLDPTDDDTGCSTPLNDCF